MSGIVASMSPSDLRAGGGRPPINAGGQARRGPPGPWLDGPLRRPPLSDLKGAGGADETPVRRYAARASTACAIRDTKSRWNSSADLGLVSRCSDRKSYPPLA